MLIVFRSPSGGGKSTATNILMADHDTARAYGSKYDLYGTPLWAELGFLRSKMETRNRRERHAADDFFTLNPGTPNESYKFDPQYLSQAHGQCFRRVMEACQQESVSPGTRTIIVENTNCSIAEAAPYCQLASALQLELHVITILVDPLLAWRRQVHETPITHVVKQDLTLRQSILEWPPWWPQKVFPL